MESSFRLGRIAGVEVGVNWSWLVVFALITWSLASGVFPSQDPGHSNGTYIAVAVVAALLFFASLLVHELGHAVTARREGMELDGITLWLCGGVARFKGMFPTAAAELRIAVAGPAVSARDRGRVLARRVGRRAPVRGRRRPRMARLREPDPAGVQLAARAPARRGRVLRAALWKTRHDFAWGTTVVASIGRGFGYLLIATGVFLFIFQGAFGGAWLAFIGRFLLGAAGAEQRRLAARQALSDQRRHATYPVLDDGRPVGLLAFGCLSSIPRETWDVRSVRDCMIPLEEVPRWRPDTPAIDAFVQLSDASVNRGVVLENGDLVGIVSAADLGRASNCGHDGGNPEPDETSIRLEPTLPPSPSAWGFAAAKVARSVHCPRVRLPRPWRSGARRACRASDPRRVKP